MKPTANRVRRLLSTPRFIGSSNNNNNASSTLKNNKNHVRFMDEKDATTAELSSVCSSSESHDSLLLNSEMRDGDDPYADVRDELEARSARDRNKYACHSEEGQYAQHDTVVVPALIAYTCYLGYAVLLVLGHALNFMSATFGWGRYAPRKHKGSNLLPCDDASKYAPLIGNWEKLYTRRVYARIQDCFNRPLCSAAGVYIDVLERISFNRYKSLQLCGNINDDSNDNNNNGITRDEYSGPHQVTAPDGSAARRCLNLGSYNYLGFADDWQTTCGTAVKKSLEDYPVSTSSSLQEYGRTHLMQQLESSIAKFCGKDDALVLNMGFNTNATTLPALVGPGDLILSDELNHTSIVQGARSSGAAICIFPHQDMPALERLLQQAILLGRPRTRRPWNKILVVVEGVYSMEGAYCDLQSVTRISKKYGAYVYLDEAHSIGAVGATGRGCAEYCNVSPSDIDIMMGTFTKSFAGMGGYVAGNRDVIAYLRKRCAGSAGHSAMSPVVCQQVLTALEVIMGKDGTNIGKQKIQSLRDNSNYFRMRLEEMGLQVLGPYDSPVIPVMLYHMTKIAAFSRECLKRGLAVVVVGAPAVPLLECRARFCMSAHHTRADLDMALKEIAEIVDIIQIRHAHKKE